ncbi:hypothetical protein Pmani_015560 [Petrolisthes manimaculis]|uniref:Nuclear envelope integral membrane protein 1 n=1 Tax=Petrolisthes manimaculis TaxID=1843537 RepID=A0AAE1U786_9EUCA|nr:hypothetical protein Pmani_015560 [Petrolisthes manimaculis]
MTGVDFWRVVTLVTAVIIFFTSVRLARNVFFHYTTGITFGVFCSLLILVYVVAKMLPKKSSAVAVMVGGWGLIVYMVQHLWQNFLVVVKEHHAVVIGYVVVVGLISFAAVYRYGPLTDQRSVNLVQWGMQLSALLALFMCSQYREATLGIAIVMVSCYAVPERWKAKLRTFWVRRFPPKVRRLTEEEYLQQANVETRRALEDLREFCRSPKCDKWNVVSKLNTPHRFVEFVGARNSRQRGTSNKAQKQRFAEFVEGGSHLDDEAILAYESNDLRPPRDEDNDDLYMTTDSDGDLDNQIDENGEMT